LFLSISIINFRFIESFFCMQFDLLDINKAQEFNPDSNQIVRSNSFINGRYRFTLLQNKIMLLLCSQVQHGDEPGKLYTLPVARILAGTKSQNFSHVVDNALLLQNKTIKVPVINKLGKEYIDSVNLLYKVRYPKDYSGNIYIAIHPDLRPHFLDLKEYSKYMIDNVWEFKHEHSFRIYELLKEYRNKGLKKRYFSQTELKEKLGIPDTYMKKAANGEVIDDFKDFRRYVLEKAIEDCERCADITFTIEPKKSGRRIIGFTLHIIDRLKKLSKPIPLPEPYDERTFDANLIVKLEKEYDKGLVMFCVEKALNDPKINNPEGWVRKALEEGYIQQQYNEHLHAMQQKKAKKASKDKALQEKEFRQAKEKQIGEEYGRFWKERCLHYFEKYQDQLENYLDQLQKLNGHDPKTRRALEELAAGNPGEAAKQKIGNFILQQEGLPEEKSVKAFALKKYNVHLD
jgi:hypothetical protein